MSEPEKRPPGRPPSEEARAALLDAAWWRLIEDGYGALTVDAIAKAAGAGKQTLYRRWPTKAALVIEALTEKTAQRIDRPKEAAIRKGDLAAYLHAEFASLKPYGTSLAALFAEAQATPQTAEAFRAAIVKPRQIALREVLAGASPDPALRDALVEAIDGAIWRRIFLGEPLDDAFARRLALLAASGA
jgi:AcrR family transcriptional regulator